MKRTLKVFLILLFIFSGTVITYASEGDDCGCDENLTGYIVGREIQTSRGIIHAITEPLFPRENENFILRLELSYWEKDPEELTFTIHRGNYIQEITLNSKNDFIAELSFERGNYHIMYNNDDAYAFMLPVRPNTKSYEMLFIFLSLIPLMYNLYRKRSYKIVSTVIYIGFITTLYFLLFGIPVASLNLGSVSMRYIWWTVLPLSIWLFGKLWCEICPLKIIGRAAEKVI